MGLITHPFETAPSEGEAIEVAKDILWMRFPLPMALDHVNVYALWDEDGWTIVDTGFYSKKGVAIWEALIDGPLGGKPIARVLLTHHHPDHVGMVGWFMKNYGAELITTRTAFLLSRMLVLDVQETWPEETMRFYWRNGMNKEYYDQRAKGRPFNFADTVHQIPNGYTRIQEGDQITLGGRVWDIYEGHGHAPEHAVLVSRDDDLLISGDQIIAGISSNISVYATEPMADPLGEWLESCTKFRDLVRDDQFVLPGHKLPFRGAKERLEQLIVHHEGGLKRMLKMMDRPMQPDDFFDTLFMRKIGVMEYGFAFGEALAHLNHLHALGKVTRELDENDQYQWSKP
ncbi:MAG: MBL fold metallo-hydrolase [Pseudomonadota bacterium]